MQQPDGTWRETLPFRGIEDPHVVKGKGISSIIPSPRAIAPDLVSSPRAPPERPDEQYPFWLCTASRPGTLAHRHAGRRVPQPARHHARAPTSRCIPRTPSSSSAGRDGAGENTAGRDQLPLWIEGRTAAGTLFIVFDERMPVKRTHSRRMIRSRSNHFEMRRRCRRWDETCEAIYP